MKEACPVPSRPPRRATTICVSMKNGHARTRQQPKWLQLRKSPRHIGCWRSSTTLMLASCASDRPHRQIDLCDGVVLAVAHATRLGRMAEFMPHSERSEPGRDKSASEVVVVT